MKPIGSHLHWVAPPTLEKRLEVLAAIKMLAVPVADEQQRRRTVADETAIALEKLRRECIALEQAWHEARHEAAMIFAQSRARQRTRAERARTEALLKRGYDGYDPNEPRVPKHHAGGGEWTRSTVAAADTISVRPGEPLPVPIPHEPDRPYRFAADDRQSDSNQPPPSGFTPPPNLPPPSGPSWAVAVGTAVGAFIGGTVGAVIGGGIGAGVGTVVPGVGTIVVGTGGAIEGAAEGTALGAAAGHAWDQLNVLMSSGSSSGASITPRPDVSPQGGGRGGEDVKNLTGPPNSAIPGFGGRIYITNDRGQVVLDVTQDRAKVVVPGSGYRGKRSPTPTELDLLNKTRP